MVGAGKEQIFYSLRRIIVDQEANLYLLKSLSLLLKLLRMSLSASMFILFIFLRIVSWFCESYLAVVNATQTISPRYVKVKENTWHFIHYVIFSHWLFLRLLKVECLFIKADIKKSTSINWMEPLQRFAAGTIRISTWTMCLSHYQTWYLLNSDCGQPHRCGSIARDL